MKVEVKDGHIPCQICGHLKEIHMQVCGDRNCDCLCFLGPGESSYPSWQETAIMAAFDLIMEQKEGTVTMRTDDGQECLVRVQFVPSVGYTVTGVGKS